MLATRYLRNAYPQKHESLAGTELSHHNNRISHDPPPPPPNRHPSPSQSSAPSPDPGVSHSQQSKTVIRIRRIGPATTAGAELAKHDAAVLDAVELGVLDVPLVRRLLRRLQRPLDVVPVVACEIHSLISSLIDRTERDGTGGGGGGVGSCGCSDS